MADEVDFADQIIEDNVNRAVGNIKSKFSSLYYIVLQYINKVVIRLDINDTLH